MHDNVSANPFGGVVNRIPKPSKRADFDIPIGGQGNDVNVIKLSVDLIDPSPYQPRLYFDQDAIASLAKSIDETKQATPIIVRRKTDGRYELIGGERRLRAILLLKKPVIDASVLPLVSDSEAALFAVIDNDAKAELTEYERGLSYKKLLEEGVVASQSDLATKLSISPATVTRCMAYTKFPDQVLEILNKKPSIMGSRVVADFVKLCEDGHTAIVVECLEGVLDGLYSQDAALAKAKNDSNPKPIKVNTQTAVVTQTGKKLGSITLNKRLISFKCEKDLDPDVVYKAITEMLEKLS